MSPLFAFDRTFKEARRTFKSICKTSTKLKPISMAAEFDRLAAYRELEQELQQRS